jgi:hypothetical protein
VKQIPPEMLRLIAETHGYADLQWTRSIPIPGDDDFPVLQLPATKLEYVTERGYPIKLEPRRWRGADGRDSDRFLLFVQIESFEIAKHDEAGWAIPTKYKPETDEERIAQELGFDEGWEDASMECMFICDQRFSVFWRAALQRGRFGLTVPETQSLYPVTLGKRERGPLKDILAKWTN